MKINQLKESKLSTYNIEDIPKNIGDITLTQKDRDLLSKGQSTSLIVNVKDKEGKSENIILKIDKGYKPDGVIENIILVKTQKKELKIPNNINNIELSSFEKELLLNDGYIGPILLSKNEYFLNINHELNDIEFVKAKDLGLPEKIEDYTLNSKDKLTLINGGELHGVKLRNQHNNTSYISNISFKDKKVVFTRTKLLKPIDRIISIFNRKPNKDFTPKEEKDLLQTLKNNPGIKEEKHQVNTIISKDIDKLKVDIDKNLENIVSTNTNEDITTLEDNLNYNLDLLKNEINLGINEKELYKKIINNKLSNTIIKTQITSSFKELLLKSKLSDAYREQILAKIEKENTSEKKQQKSNIKLN